jgi:acyl CoA:acetate/3-ketoacid CoA transferase alpha subunit/acyl CoA:acetate/3-ketoacid CoA transferase beta subunit
LKNSNARIQQHRILSGIGQSAAGIITMKMNDITGFNPELEPGAMSKLLLLKEAVSRHVKPGMKLHLAGGIGGPSAVICEIIRQYYGKRPGFTLIQSTVTGHAINLLHRNLIKKMIFSACMDLTTSGRPSRVMQKAWEEKSIEFENWSLCSLQQRLMAGAMGVSFMPTRSIAGSDLALDNSNAFQEIDDPFGTDAKIGLVQAINPDISIVHGCVADELGNTILSIPYGDDLWGALASSQGVLVTVEKIVPTDFIREHAALVKIPGYIVNAVSIAPMGLHPFLMVDPGINDLDAYETDTEFLQELHKAFAEDRTLDAWIKEWVIDCATQEDYLNKLGSRRIKALKKITVDDSERSEPSAKSLSPETEPEYTPEEMMLVAASREISKSVLKSGHRTILVGAGSRAVAVLLVYYKLRAQGYELELITGNGQIGYDPQPATLATQSVAGVYSSKMLTDTVTTHGVIVGGENSKCLGVLGAGQIDRYGNTNSTLTSEGQFLVGSGGANDTVNAREVIVIVNQSKNRFVEKLPYITGPGNRVTTVVSTMGIFNKPQGKGELHLTACFPAPELLGLEDRIKKVQENCGWTLKLADRVEEVPVPIPDELKMLRWLVPLAS